MTLDAIEVEDPVAPRALRHDRTSCATAVDAPAMRRDALSADASLLRRLRGPRRRARVHSVFARVINIDLGDGRLLALAGRGTDDAPDTVVVDLEAWSGLGIERGVDAMLSARRIDLAGAVSVALDRVRPWRGRLPDYAPDERRLRANLPLAWAYLERHSAGLAIGSNATATSGRFEAVAAAAFRAQADGLLRALAHDDEARAIAHVDRLLGLGTGLTPSGDDVLVGLLAALNVPRSPHDAGRGIGARVLECAGERTHRVSAAALLHAARGRVRASIAELCRALMHEESMGVLDALERVMRIGSGSGSEIAFGVLAGFRLHLRRDDRHRAPPARGRITGVAHGG